MAGDMTLSIRIRADGSAAVTGLKQVDQALDETGRSARRAGDGFSGLRTAMGQAAVAFAGVETLRAMVQAFKETNIEAGRLRASLETVAGTQAAASAAWQRLEGFAKSTPYSLAQSVEAFTKLIALGLDPSEQALRSYGNTASAMGKDLMQMIEAVADASTGEFERLKEFGIKASAQGEQVQLTFRGVTTTLAKDAGAITGYLKDIGETQFAGAMERQAKTLGGAFSNLEDAVAAFWRAVGDAGATNAAINALQRVTGILEGTANLLNGLGFTRFADDESKFNALLQQRIALQQRWAEQVQRVESLQDRRGTVWETMFPALAPAEAQLRAIGQELGAVTAQIATIQEGNKQLAQGENTRANATKQHREEVERLGNSLKGEEKIIADLEAQYGLLRGELMAIWELESKRGKIAGVDSRRTVTDQTNGRPVEIVGEFQMQPGTAAGVDGDLSTWLGQATAAARELARLKAMGLDVGERLAGYHGGPGAARNPGPRGRDYVERGLAIIRDYGNDVALPSELDQRSQAQVRAAAEARKAIAEQIQTGREADAVYRSLVQPMEQYVANLQSQQAAAGLTAQQQARLNAELEITAQVAAARAQQVELARRAAEEAVRTGAPVDMRAADQAGEAAKDIEAQKAAILGLAEATARAKDTTAENLPTIGELWTETLKEMGRGIQQNLAGAFEQVFNGTLKSTADFMDSLKRVILNALAQLAAAIVMRPLTVAINGVLGMSASGTAPAGTGGAGTGLLGSLGSLSQLFTGNGIGAGLAGLRLFGGTGGATGPLTQTGAALAGMPNWAYGLAGIGGGLLGSALFPRSPYSGLTGSLGGFGGMALGTAYGGTIAAGMGMTGAAAGAMAGSVVPIIGTLIGALAGGALGGLFGGNEDDTPQKEAWLMRRKQEWDARDQALAEQQAAAAAAHNAYMQQVMDERKGLEDNLLVLIKGEAEARRQQLADLEGSNYTIGDLTAAFGDLKEAATALQSRYQQIADGLKSWTQSTRDALTGTNLPAAKDAYQTQLVAAKAGDLDAMAGLTGAADRYLAAALEQAGSRADYQRLVAQVLADVEGVQGQAQSAADRLADLTGRTHETLQQQYNLALKSAQQALTFYEASANANQAIIDALRALNLGGRGYATGGISTGPTSGYPVTLHGTEAVIPLATGSVPVTIQWGGLVAGLQALAAAALALRQTQQEAQRVTRQTAAPLLPPVSQTPRQDTVPVPGFRTARAGQDDRPGWPPPGPAADLPLRTSLSSGEGRWEQLLADLNGLTTEVQTLRLEQRRQHQASLTEQRDGTDVLRRWEAIGMPETRL